jgi:hypothetical protein
MRRKKARKERKQRPSLAGQALACIEDAAVIEKILTHFQGKDTSVSTSLRHYNPPELSSCWQQLHSNCPGFG